MGRLIRNSQQPKIASPVSADTVCPECGLRTPNDRPDCAAQRDALFVRDYEQSAFFWRFHRLAIDAYCIQHSAYVASAKSLAAHLCGLCIRFEFDNNQEKLRQLQRWLSTNPRIDKPELPTDRGSLTIGSVSGITNPEAYGLAVERWAASAWEAYKDLHPIARKWLGLSFRSPRKG